jgi:hypothetical protein
MEPYAPYAFFLGGLIGTAVKAWLTTSQATFSKQSAVDVALGGIVGLLWNLYPPFALPAGASLVQQAALVGLTTYAASDVVGNFIALVQAHGAPAGGALRSGVNSWTGKP